MPDDSKREQFYQHLETLNESERRAVLASLSKQELHAIEHDWRYVARPKQLPPPEPWSIWLLLAGRGFGKELDVDTPIPTPNGWQRMEDLRTGDQVFADDGSICNVTEAHPIMVGLQCFELSFDDGSTVVASAEHRWLTWDKRARKAHGRATNPTIGPKVRTTAELAATIHSKRADGRTELNHSIDVCGALNLPKRDLPIEPYLLGVWLGDGDSRGGYLTIADAELIDDLRKDGHTVHLVNGKQSDRCFRYHIEGLTTALRVHGLKNNKHIPREYLRANELSRRQLLAGLIDTDGHVSSGGQIEFTNTNTRLARNVLELARSLGIKATLSEGRAMLYGRDCGPKYRVCFTTRQPISHMPRKLMRENAFASSQSKRYIVSVKPVETRPVRCISVDSPSRLYLCGEAMIPTHNTRTASEWLASQMLDVPGNYAVIGRTAKETREVLLRGESGLIEALRRRNQQYGRITASGDFEFDARDLIIRHRNGSTVFGYSGETPDAVRGSNLSGIWYDELAFYQYAREVWDQSQLALRIGGSKSVVTTTPKAGAPTELLKEIIARKTSRVTTGTSYENARNLSPEFVEHIKSKEGTTLGRIEVYAELLDDLGIFWNDSDFIHTPISLERLDRIVVAVDPSTSSEDRTNETGIIVAGRSTDPETGKTIGHVLADLSTPQGVEINGKIICQAFHDWNADAIVVETNNGGDYIPFALRSIDANVHIKTVTATRGKAIRAEPIAGLYQQRRVHHSQRFAKLESQMIGFNPDRPRNRHHSPDRVDALVWALTDLFNTQPISRGIIQDARFSFF